MIFLSSSALRYAVDICQEKERYRVGIASMDAYKLEAMRELLPTLITDRDCIERIINSKIEFKIYFKNGSLISFLCSSNQALGRRLHLLIADTNIPIDIMNSVLRPCENLAWREYTYGQQTLKV